MTVTCTIDSLLDQDFRAASTLAWAISYHFPMSSRVAAVAKEATRPASSLARASTTFRLGLATVSGPRVTTGCDASGEPDGSPDPGPHPTTSNEASVRIDAIEPRRCMRRMVGQT